MTISLAEFSRDVKAAGTLAHVARAVVDAGVADACALGWARFDGARWHEDVSGALARARGGVPMAAGAHDAPEDVLFDLASLTKPMLAVALAKIASHTGDDLVKRAPLRELLNEAHGTRSADVALERLLSHRAGLEANLPLFVRLRDERPVPARADLFAQAADARRAECRGAVPEEGFAPLYSDLGYVLAGEAIARVHGAADAGAVIAERVVRPLGLERALGTARELERAGVDVTKVAAPTEIVDWRGGVVRGRVHDENAWMLTGEGGSGHAGMFGNVRAVLAFGRDVLERMGELEWTWRPRANGTLRAGFDGKSAEGSSAGDVLGARAFGHLGFTGTSVWIDPDARVVVALLTNRVHPTRDNLGIRTARPLVHDALARFARRR